jgi:hypothetical protein
MANVWITYAWTDNQTGDVDFIAQELQRHGLTIKLDRWTLRAGMRLWEQIARFIQDPSESDAWLLIATQNSLGSEPCKEEYAYALDRALRVRGGNFPVIALFPASVDDDLIPAGIRTRLHVSLQDPEWYVRIKATAEGSPLPSAATEVPPFQLTVHQLPGEGAGYAIEVRPRAGTWSPFVAEIPSDEASGSGISLMHGPSGRLPRAGILVGTAEGTSADGAWRYVAAANEATPTQSYYIYCSVLPSKLKFGPEVGIRFIVGTQ